MKAKSPEVHTYISNKTKIKGELFFEGCVRIDNELEGNILSNSGLLVIGAQALIKGDIKAEEVVVMGTVDGSIEALEYVELADSGKVTGNIFAPKVNFVPGSIFVGRCTIGARPIAQIDAKEDPNVIDMPEDVEMVAEAEKPAETDGGESPAESQ